ncbi:MAG: hypothetical protein BWY76_01021 [bacterium ADurb.Bin429]|nr:MAG: hypothetical protein BWY76_01021 [bacterium ADurb.Bin429]
MGYYLDRERLTQAMLKHQLGFFSEPACADW